MRFCNFQLVTSVFFWPKLDTRNTPAQFLRGLPDRRKRQESLSPSWRWPDTLPVKWYIYLHCYMNGWIFMVNVGKYTIHGTRTLPETNISAPANQKNWEDDPFLFEILPIFQEAFAVSFRARNSTTRHWIEYRGTTLEPDWRSNLLQWIRPFHGCLQCYNLLTHIGSLSFHRNFPRPNRKQMGLSINSSTHWKLEKNHNKIIEVQASMTA